jgi:hypothetical protein
MALTYEESAALMNDFAFRGRIKVACLTFANYILSEATTTVAHNTRVKWANQALNNSDFVAGQVQSPVVMDPQVQADGSAITDAALQESVETTVNNLM